MGEGRKYYLFPPDRLFIDLFKHIFYLYRVFPKISVNVYVFVLSRFSVLVLMFVN